MTVDENVGVPATQKTQSEVIIPGRAEQALRETLQAFFGETGGSISNFDGDPQKKWRLIAICSGSAVMKADDLKGQAFPVKYWYAHKVKIFQPQGGEYLDATRVVLLSPDYQAVGFTSEGITQSLAQMIMAFGLKPFDPPVNIRVDEITTRMGRKTYALAPVL